MNPKKYPIFNFRLTPEVEIALDALSRSSGLKRSRVVKKAIIAEALRANNKDQSLNSPSNNQTL